MDQELEYVQLATARRRLNSDEALAFMAYRMERGLDSIEQHWRQRLADRLHELMSLRKDSVNGATLFKDEADELEKIAEKLGVTIEWTTYSFDTMQRKEGRHGESE